MAFLNLLACFLSFFVVLAGAFTRLMQAGLGCPDWPLCYGKWLANSLPLSSDILKGNIEMAHRYLAGSLILICVFLLINSFKKNKRSSIQCYATVCGLLSIQACLGMLTVLLKLNAFTIMLHLVVGVSITGLLWWHYLSYASLNENFQPFFEGFIALGLLLVFIQLFSGAWTSAHYAGLACGNFLTCPYAHLSWNISEDLLNKANMQLLHRILALLISIYLSLLSVSVFIKGRLSQKICALLLMLVLSIQISLGIVNIKYYLPLQISLLHTAFALLLTLILISLLKLSHAKKI